MLINKLIFTALLASCISEWSKIQCMYTKGAWCEEGCWEGASPWLPETESTEKNKVMIEKREGDSSGGNVQ